MAKMTREIQVKLEDIRVARHGLPIDLSDFIRYSVAMIYMHGEEVFDSRRDMKVYVDTLGDVVTAKVNQ